MGERPTCEIMKPRPVRKSRYPVTESEAGRRKKKTSHAVAPRSERIKAQRQRRRQLVSKHDLGSINARGFIRADQCSAANCVGCERSHFDAVFCCRIEHEA